MADEDAIVLSFGDSLLRRSDIDLLTAPNEINDKIIGFCFDERSLAAAELFSYLYRIGDDNMEGMRALIKTKTGYYEREQFNHSADRIALISPSVTQLIRFASVQDLVVLLESLHLPTKQYVFVPINDNQDTERVGGTHWSLMVYVRSKQEFQHFDAIRGCNQAVARKLVDKLQPFVQAPRGKLKFIEMDCPQQQNSYDCGMYVIAMAEHLIKEFCECFSVGVSEVVNQDMVHCKRKQIQDLILELAAADINNVDHHLST